MYCAKCGNPLAEGAKFCAECGTAVDESAAVIVRLDEPELDLVDTWFGSVTTKRVKFRVRHVGPDSFADIPLQHITGIRAEIVHAKVLGWLLILTGGIVAIAGMIDARQIIILGLIISLVGLIPIRGWPTVHLETAGRGRPYYLRGQPWQHDDLERFANAVRRQLFTQPQR
jgi:hypothetical protein